MTKQEKNDIDVFIRKILKSGTLVQNTHLSKKARYGKNLFASTNVVPMFKIVAEVKKLVKKYGSKKKTR